MQCLYNPGWSVSSAANRLVHEGLRMAAHPGIVFRDGPTGRRAGLVGGADVWEVVRAVRSARSTEPGFGQDEVLAVVSSNAGMPTHLVRTAVRYWAAHPEEIDREIEAATAAEDAAERELRREHDLLNR